MVGAEDGEEERASQALGSLPGISENSSGLRVKCQEWGKNGQAESRGPRPNATCGSHASSGVLVESGCVQHCQALHGAVSHSVGQETPVQVTDALYNLMERKQLSSPSPLCS